METQMGLMSLLTVSKRLDYSDIIPIFPNEVSH